MNDATNKKWNNIIKRSKKEKKRSKKNKWTNGMKIKTYQVWKDVVGQIFG